MLISSLKATRYPGLHEELPLISYSQQSFRCGFFVIVLWTSSLNNVSSFHIGIFCYLSSTVLNICPYSVFFISLFG